MITTTQQITRLLKWTETEYAEFVNDMGIDYLNAYIPNDLHGIYMLNNSRMYWNWWKNHWQIRDMEFLEIVNGEGYTKMLQRLYTKFHSVSRLINEIYPNAQVLGSDYCRMIGKLQDAK
jgi:hypothetical protein